MFKYISIKDQLLRERRMNEILQANTAKMAADIDYMAMMCEVELETEGTEETNDEQI